MLGPTLTQRAVVFCNVGLNYLPTETDNTHLFTFTFLWNTKLSTVSTSHILF